MKSNLNEFSRDTLARQGISHTTSSQEYRTAHAFDRNSVRYNGLLRNKKRILPDTIYKSPALAKDNVNVQHPSSLW